ncbi:unnamed protein product [Ascophyllum nodosum]
MRALRSHKSGMRSSDPTAQARNPPCGHPDPVVLPRSAHTDQNHLESNGDDAGTHFRGKTPPDSNKHQSPSAPVPVPASEDARERVALPTPSPDGGDGYPRETCQPGDCQKSLFGVDESKPTILCEFFREDSMTSVHHQDTSCCREGCDRKAEAGPKSRPGEIDLFCSSHQSPAVIATRTEHCQFVGCWSTPKYGQRQGPLSFCQHHKRAGMHTNQNGQLLVATRDGSAYKDEDGAAAMGGPWTAGQIAVKDEIQYTTLSDFGRSSGEPNAYERSEPPQSPGQAVPQGPIEPVSLEHRRAQQAITSSPVPVIAVTPQFRKMCEVEGCRIQPSYGASGTSRPRFCSSHKQEGMVGLKNRPCTFTGCNTRPHYGLPGCRPIYCAKHKKAKMVHLLKEAIYREKVEGKRDLGEAPSAPSEPEHLEPKHRLLATRSKQKNIKKEASRKDVEGAQEESGQECADSEPPPAQQQERQQTNATESGSNGERGAKASTAKSTSPKEVIPQRLRRTESQRSADLARKRARYAQRTEAQRLHDAHKKRTSVGSYLQHPGAASPATAARDAETLRARQQQEANTVAVAEGALQARHEETTRLTAARDAETLRARQQQQANTVAVAEAALQAQHEETTRLAAARDAETLRARQQQQANTVAVAEAALQAQHKEMTRLAAARDAETRRAQQQQQERQQKNNNETNATESGSNGERRVKASTFMSTSPKEAIPQRLRRTETQRMADLARKRARYAQRTEAQRLYDAHKKRTSRGSFLHHLGGASPATAAREAETRRACQQQQANAIATAAAALQARHEETIRLAAARDAETLRARQQQQANTVAVAEAALQAQHEETTRQAAAEAAAAEAAKIAAEAATAEAAKIAAKARRAPRLVVMTSFKIEDPSTSDSGGAGPQPRSGHMTSCRLADNMDMTPSVEINVLKETRESARATAEASGPGRRARIPSRKALEASGKLKNEDIQWLTKEKKEEDAKRVKELKAQRKAAAAAGLKAGEVIEAVAIGGMGGGTSADTGGNGDGVETLSGLPKMTWRKLSPTEILEAAKRQPITKVAVKPPHCGSSVAASEKRDASDYEIGKRLIDTDAGTSDKCRHKKVVSEAHETVWMDSAKTSPGRSEDSTRQRGSLEVHKQALLDHTRGILPRSSSREAIVRDGESFSGSGQIGSVSVCHFEGCSRKATFGVNGNVRYCGLHPLFGMHRISNSE